jgi:ATP-dependent helicase/nuclease subunit A
VKQSIYRFRLANPRIFRNYAGTWRGDRGKTICLTENFRSREALLSFLNSLFSLLMQEEADGPGYDENARLQFGAPDERDPLSLAANPEPRVELHLRFKGNGNATGDTDEEPAGALAGIADLEDADKEARLIAIRLRELKAQRHQVWDEEAKAFRAVEWKDMAVLLRSPANKVEGYAREFSRLEVPLIVARGGFYESLEISDLLNLLRLLDNPLQDLPALAVLRSPLVGLTVDELALIRLAAAGTHFWTALQRWVERSGVRCQGPEGEGEHRTSNIEHRTSNELERLKAELQTHHATRNTDHAPRTTHHVTQTPPDASNPEAITLEKVSAFLERFARWRRLARQISLSRCLDAVLSETHYAEWLLTQSRGEQRRANVQRLLGLAQRFDQFQRQGLFRFLRFVEAQQAAETEPEVASVNEENAVRLMSIHQSKGLEFPVVVVADLGKPFNFADANAEIILDEAYGLCPHIKLPHAGSRYPSLPHWLARRRQKLETLSEEQRLLYVATTRARDSLILTATVSAKKFESHWRKLDDDDADPASARSYTDWLGRWFASHCPAGGGEMSGKTALVRWSVHDDTELLIKAGNAREEGFPAAAFSADAGVWAGLHRRLAWRYPFAAATQRPAKTSVTALRRQAAELAEEALPLGDLQFEMANVKSKTAPPKVSEAGKAVESGTAHHKFLQRVSLDRLGGLEELRREAERLEREGILTAEETTLLDFGALAHFWRSDFGRKVLAQAPFVRRELPFTARFSASELAEIIGEPNVPELADEFVVVQGVADLAVILPKETWLVDFKTDDVAGEELAARAKQYEPQLKLYALALWRIYGQPVTDCRLHFLAARETLLVETINGSLTADGPSAAKPQPKERGCPTRSGCA